MASEWKTLPVADAPLEIIDGDRGVNYPKQEDFGTSGDCLFLNTGNVTTTGFNFADRSFITKEKDVALRKGKLKRHDVVLTTRGTVGNVAIFDDSVHFEDVRINSGMVLLRADQSKLLPRFLFQFVRSPLFKEQVAALTTGSAQPQLPIRDIRRVEIPLPPLAEQKAIASILGALDDKIELNRRMNATLEGMARALFQSWFVDFDPVRAKLDGRKLEGLDKSTAALFPEHFDHKAEGVVPTGWNRKRWGDIATLEYGKSIREYRESDGKYQVFGTNGPIGFHDEALCKSAGIVIGRKGAYRGVHYSPDPFFVIDTAFYLKPKAELDLKWCYYELLRFDINSMDSGSAIPSTSRDDFYGIPVIVPSPEIQATFGKIVGGWFAKVFANDQESRTLANLRDTLLPKLLSGELSVVNFLL
jgi:type I restriction enzyme S subunit